MNVETEVHPPEPDVDEGDDSPSCRIGAHLNDVNDYYYDAAVQLFDVAATNPDDIAEAIVKTMLGLARLHSPEVAWAVQQRLIGYDGS